MEINLFSAASNARSIVVNTVLFCGDVTQAVAKKTLLRIDMVRLIGRCISVYV